MSSRNTQSAQIPKTQDERNIYVLIQNAPLVMIIIALWKLVHLEHSCAVTCC